MTTGLLMFKKMQNSGYGCIISLIKTDLKSSSPYITSREMCRFQRVRLENMRIPFECNSLLQIP
jgi:hypothetical protein